MLAVVYGLVGIRRRRQSLVISPGLSRPSLVCLPLNLEFVVIWWREELWCTGLCRGGDWLPQTCTEIDVHDAELLVDARVGSVLGLDRVLRRLLREAVQSC